MDYDETELIALVTALVLLLAALLTILTSYWRVLDFLHGIMFLFLHLTFLPTESGAVLIFGVIIGIITWLVCHTYEHCKQNSFLYSDIILSSPLEDPNSATKYN